MTHKAIERILFKAIGGYLINDIYFPPETTFSYNEDYVFIWHNNDLIANIPYIFIVSVS